MSFMGLNDFDASPLKGLVSMAVATDYRRMGIGEAMARKSIDRFAGRVKRVYLEVRPSSRIVHDRRARLRRRGDAAGRQNGTPIPRRGVGVRHYRLRRLGPLMIPRGIGA